MTVESALNLALVNDVDIAKGIDFSDWSERQIGYIREAIQIVKAAAEKQIPKKPANKKRFFADVYIGNCPNCGGNVRNAEMFCSKCGQALDWSDKK